jgi:hypothetical protein
MKTMKLTFLLLLFCSVLVAPPVDRPVLYIETPTIISYFDSITGYDALIDAVVKWESDGDTCAFNPKENAVGAFQIRQCRIDHYNALNGTKYTLNDCYDYKLSKRIFLFFAKGKDWEQAARDWNGSGPMTVEYWENVKKFI